MSGNHDQSFECAPKQVDAAADRGADVIRPQTYAVEIMTPNLRVCGLVVDHANSLLGGGRFDVLYHEVRTSGGPRAPITLREDVCGDLALLECTSTYPATPQNTNISTIPHMPAWFGCEVSLSDHTMGCGAAMAATAQDAEVIEKHFILRRAGGGVDSALSMEPHGLRQLPEEAERAGLAVGQVSCGPTATEVKSLAFRRSLYIAQDMKAGEVLTRENLRGVRPGFGLPHKPLESLLGQRIGRDVAAGTPMAWALLSPESAA